MHGARKIVGIPGNRARSLAETVNLSKAGSERRSPQRAGGVVTLQQLSAIAGFLDTINLKSSTRESILAAVSRFNETLGLGYRIEDPEVLMEVATAELSTLSSKFRAPGIPDSNRKKLQPEVIRHIKEIDARIGGTSIEVDRIITELLRLHPNNPLITPIKIVKILTTHDKRTGRKKRRINASFPLYGEAGGLPIASLRVKDGKLVRKRQPKDRIEKGFLYRFGSTARGIEQHFIDTRTFRHPDNYPDYDPRALEKIESAIIRRYKNGRGSRRQKN